MTPRAFYRLQFHKAFPLDAAVPLVDYLADLGISHVCASPLLRSRPGPRHGYNVVDFGLIDPDVGGEHSLRRFVGALRRRRMGLVMEIAPGHMGVGGGDNEAWLNLLEWGRDSAFAPWFDVNWRAGEIYQRNKVLVPFLDRPYWEALTSGALAFAFDDTQGRFVVRHQGHIFPICPTHYVSVMDAAEAPALNGMRAIFRGLSTLRPDKEEVRAAKYRLTALAGTDEGRVAMRALMTAFDARSPEGRTRLHELLERQNYRLAWWRTANDDLNWRRYLDASGLAGIKLERTDVFDAVHAYVFKLYGEGLVDGLSVAHLDLMADPGAYARRLEMKLASLASRRPPEAPALGCVGLPLHLTAPRSKKTDTEAAQKERRARAAEDAMEAIGLVLHDPAAAPVLSDSWSALSGDRQRYDDLRADARRTVLAERLDTELQAATRALHEVAAALPEGRDLTFAAIKRVLRELAIAFPAPRAYGDMDGRSTVDEAQYEAAFAKARPHMRTIDLPVADVLARWLGGEAPRAIADFEQSGARAEAIVRFQQLTACLEATAQDETVLSRYARLLSRNEVGSDPTVLACRPLAFHTLMGERLKACNGAPTITAGPGTKRGEDARMRLAAISELPKEWDALARRLMEHMAPFRTRIEDGVCPDPADEVLLYQGLIAAWPLNLRLDDQKALADLKTRIQRWFLEAIRHSGRRTRWLFGNDAYERGCARFVDLLLLDPMAQTARGLLAAFVERVSLPGAINAYSALTLKCMMPGVPEIYQGTEHWDFALGDPDNRRAVDFGARGAALTAALRPDVLLQTWPDGRAKQALMARLLRVRAALPTVFSQGTYEPLVVEGMREESALAFLRRHGDKVVIVAITRLAMHLLGPGAMPPRVPTVRWGDTGIALPEGVEGPFRDIVSNREVETSLRRLDVGDLFTAFPVSVLVKSGSIPAEPNEAKRSRSH